MQRKERKRVWPEYSENSSDASEGIAATRSALHFKASVHVCPERLSSGRSGTWSFHYAWSPQPHLTQHVLSKGGPSVSPTLPSAAGRDFVTYWSQTGQAWAPRAHRYCTSLIIIARERALKIRLVNIWVPHMLQTRGRGIQWTRHKFLSLRSLHPSQCRQLIN